MRSYTALICLACIWLCSHGGAFCQEHNLAKVDDSITRGIEFLVRMQRMDGAWNSYGNSTNLGQTALCALALRKAGLPKDHPCLKKAVNFIQHNHPVRTYDVSVLLALLEALDPVEHKEWVEGLAEMLMNTQRNNLWAYPTGALDMSNTQYAALGLFAARNCGYKTGSEVWRDLLEGAVDCQKEDGGWAYRNDRSHHSTGAMTCAGLTCLFVCQICLTHNGAKRIVLPGYEKTLKRGLAWLDQHFVANKNPRPSENPKNYRWTFYYLYGIERVGALSKQQYFGKKDWYLEGVNWLVPKQGKNGGWGSAYGEKEMNTSFALLFLSRATVGAITKGGLKTRVKSNDKDKKEIIIGCDRKNPGYVWVDSWSKKVAEKFGIRGGDRVIRVEKVEYYCNDDLMGVVTEGETDKRITRFPLKYSFKENGEKPLSAKVFCVSAHGTVRQTYESGKIKLYVHNVFTEKSRSLMEDVGDNLVRGVKTYMSASSEYDSGWRASLATDGYQGTAWLSAAPEKDPAPWIELDFEKPVRADKLKLTHAQKHSFDRHRFGRACKIMILINRGKQKIITELGTDDAEKYEIPFKRTRIRELKIEVLDRVKGHHHTACGFSEIELFLTKKR